MSTPLDYAVPNRLRLFPWRRLGWFIAAIFAGLIYWWNADWWAYVQPDDGSPPWPEFTVPWWWQAIESLVVGVVLTSPLPIGVWLWHRFRKCRHDL
jgi:hypothetical protein